MTCRRKPTWLPSSSCALVGDGDDAAIGLCTAADEAADPCTAADDVAAVDAAGSATGQMQAPACADVWCSPQNQTGNVYTPFVLYSQNSGADDDALCAALWIRPLRSCATKLPNLPNMTTSPWSVTSRAATNALCTPATRMFEFTSVPISVTTCNLLPPLSCTLARPSAVTYLNPLAGDANPNTSPTYSGHADTALPEPRVKSIFSHCSNWRWCDTVQQLSRLQSVKDPAAVCRTGCCRFCCWGSLQFSPVSIELIFLPFPLLLPCSSLLLPLSLSLPLPWAPPPSF